MQEPNVKRSLAVENPILNDPFQEPREHWLYKEGQPGKEQGRRPAGYYMRPTTTDTIRALAEEEFVRLEIVNELRNRVRKWRADNYPGASPITKELLTYWWSPDRERRLFFCQLETAETIIFLVEAPPHLKQGIQIPPDEPADLESQKKGYESFVRYAAKMATGSGKTVVMSMIIAWSLINKALNKQDTRFSDAILLVCPTLTIKERLQVLLPSHPKNYYDEFEVVPPGLRAHIAQGKFLITNWHLFLPYEDPKRGVLRLGEESDSAFCSRVLRDLGSKGNLLVINDEGHHAWRPGKPPDEAEGKQSEEELEATVWVGGLDRINAVKDRGINLCLDFSATPFYIKGSGFDEGKPFPWIVSDFGLVDAIESGIVKVPRVPVDDNSGLVNPKFFYLWRSIVGSLADTEKGKGRAKPKPEGIFREAQGALTILASEWRKTFETWSREGSSVPPVLIIVCDNTDLAQVLFEEISKGRLFPELKNTDKEYTLRIDTKLLDKAEQVVEGMTREKAAEFLRKKLATVGKLEWSGEGEPPGKDVRCVVAVGLINEGWDAQNVTQILGLRAFTSQLLCEQVVGRGLRRTQYDDFSVPEYVDVYGVPFEVIPVKKLYAKRHEVEKLTTLVMALKERKDLETTFPRVEGYVFDVKHRIKADVSNLPELSIDPSTWHEPTEVVAKGAVGYRVGRPDRLGPGKEVVQDRNPFYETRRLQSTVYLIATRITNNLKSNEIDPEARKTLFPQVLKIVWEYIENRVKFYDAKPEELALRRYEDYIVERLSEAIEPDTDSGELAILPRLERFRETGSSSDVLFRTSRPCFSTTKSHVSHVVADSAVWEHSVAYKFERLDYVESYVRNDHLGLEIPYQFEGKNANYRPDFVVKLKRKDGSLTNVLLEVKGFEREQDKAKEVAARRWVKAINHHGQFGRWELVVCKDPRMLEEQLGKLHSSE